MYTLPQLRSVVVRFDSSINGWIQVGNLSAADSESYLYPSGRQSKDWTTEAGKIRNNPKSPRPCSIKFLFLLAYLSQIGKTV